jgi:hypothetical protein
MSVEIKLFKTDDRRWAFDIYLKYNNMLTTININRPYKYSLDNWRKLINDVPGPGCNGISLEGDHYTISSDTGETETYIWIPKDQLKDNLADVIEEAIRLKLRFK